jgi:hypothetical protein
MSEAEFPEGEDNERTGAHWEAYSDYRRVSGQVAASIDRALEAAARIESAHAEGARVSPDFAAEARSRLRAAMMMLLPEVRHENQENGGYSEILEDWTGRDGYIRRFDEVTLTNNCPGWLFDLAVDIRTVGWELGYLQAGKRERGEPADATEAEARSMFQE